MTTLTNKMRAPFGLPDGRLIPVGGSVEDVSAESLAHPVVKALIDEEKLVKGSAAARDAKPALTKG